MKYFKTLLLLLALVSCCPYHYKPNDCPDPLPPFCVPKRIKVALVLGSGGIRGMAHVGVLEELEAEGIQIDLIVGCSAGSIVGALYADNPCLQEIKDAVWLVRSRSLLEIDIWRCRFGLSQDLCMRKVLQQYLKSTSFDTLKIPLVVVTTDLHTGELIPIGAGDLIRAVQASCSIPFVFVPCEILGRVCVDGGVINAVPVKVAKDLGAEIVIAVDLCELLPQTFPTNLFQIATRSAEIAYMWQNEACTKIADIIIRPKTCQVGIFNDKMKTQIYEAGKKAARDQIPRIKKLIAEAAPDDTDPKWHVVTLPPYTPQIYHEEEP